MAQTVFNTSISLDSVITHRYEIYKMTCNLQSMHSGRNNTTDDDNISVLHI